MASMSFTSFNICKANIHPSPLPSVSFPQKASRVCFTSAPKLSQRTRATDDAEAKLKEGQDELNKAGDVAKEKSEELKENAEAAADKVGKEANKAVEGAGDAAEKAKEAAAGAWEGAKEALE